nr:uncharacterized protein LOC109785370 [Aegilops tauschii subsp. strangulata]
MIHEQADFKTLDSADIMERLNTHEEQEEEKRDLYGLSQRKNHALKAVPNSSSDGNVEEDLDDPESGRYDSSNYRGKSKSKNYNSDDENKTKKFFKKKDNSTSKSLSRSSSRNPSKSSSNRKNNSCKEIDSDEEEYFDFEEADESD